MPLDPEQPYSYHRTKKNLLGKEITKQISEKKYNKLAARYVKRGGESAVGSGYMTATQADKSQPRPKLTNPTAEYAKKKRGSKQVIKIDQNIVKRNRNIKLEMQKRLRNTNPNPSIRKRSEKNIPNKS